MEAATAEAERLEGLGIYADEEREVIARRHRIPADHPDLPALLAFCQAYDLNPMLEHVWLAPVGQTVVDGDAEAISAEVRLEPRIRRDGLLHIASRRDDYGGLQSDVVRERDSFEVRWDIGKDAPLVLHQHALKPTVPEELDEQQSWRGHVVGAWCKVHVHGRVPMFFYASLKEYGQEGDYWEGWPSAMILKAAQSYCLRVGLNVSGAAPADEMVLEPPPEEQIPEKTPEQVIRDQDYPRPFGEDLIAVVAKANELEPGSWGAPKLRIRLQGRGLEAAQEVVQEIMAENRRREKAAAARGGGKEMKAKELKKGMDIVLGPHRVWEIRTVLQEKRKVTVIVFDPDQPHKKGTRWQTEELTYRPSDTVRVVG